LAAQDHCADTGGKGVVSHTGTNGSKIQVRINRWGQASGVIGENLSFGMSEGDEYMISLFIDDGVKNRGHRNAIQNRNYKKVGIAYCPHNSMYRGMVAIAYATDFKTSYKGRREAERRFLSRRKGSNVESNTQMSDFDEFCTASRLIKKAFHVSKN
jgi:hypothetical protein